MSGAILIPLGERINAASSLAEEQRALVNARTQADEARHRSETFERRAVGAEAEADRARDRAAALAARIQQSEADLRAGQARIAIVSALQRTQARRLAERQAPIARLTAGLQAIARRPPILALLQPGSIADAVHFRIVLASAMPVIAQQTAGLRAELTHSRALRKDAETARIALLMSRDQLTQRRAELAQLEAARRIASRQFRDTAAVESDRALAMGENARDIVDLMERMEDASSVRATLAILPGPTLRPIQPGDTSLPASQQVETAGGVATYRLPVVGEIVAGFGEVSTNGVRSRGLSITTAAGAAVVAPTAGRIAFAGPFRDYGNIVIIDHGAGWTSLITHMRRLSVSVGETVRQGDPLGITASTKPQVTIELRRADRPVDIAALLH
ncbi:peptidoglycan DD-metalloendopeptidase family protein [Sphingobium sufflavum]|uniref:murein hydrolase activator EnvC family protein n=1 Tax=Sphingobium sufflavum TaxID=1129547 RepID=UPI001F46B0E1|nr:peptidoglycan DD-metalloendopeptidase family protein [Sphingobium sufflavum]MCE7795118.1 peptidoglycan DD-metalloendopeptidase family protein [Sphingobium sufflavum]